jgi:hypothetical protein
MRDVTGMRTTINIEDDILEAVKAVAARDQKPLGEVVSAMLRRAVEPNPSSRKKTRNGIPLFPISANARAVTPQQIKELLESDIDELLEKQS